MADSWTETKSHEKALSRANTMVQLTSESANSIREYSEKRARLGICVNVQDFDTQLAIALEWDGPFGRELDRYVCTSKGFFLSLMSSHVLGNLLYESIENLLTPDDLSEESEQKNNITLL